MLYVLERLLGQPSYEAVQLETVEDAAFEDNTGELVEAVQIKAEKQP